MQLSATIKVISPIRSGISQASGNEWKRQDIVLGWNEPYGDDGRMREQLLQVALTGRSVEKLATLEAKVGDRIAGRLDFDTKLHGGRVYNDIVLHLD